MKIAHLSDIHIHNLKKHNEYRIIFNELYNSLKKDNVDIIVIVGDLYESWIEISNEAEILASEFLTNLASIATTYITYGNHDCRKKNKNRLNSVESLINVMNNPNIIYLGKSGLYDIDDTFKFVNYEHLDKLTNPCDNIVYDAKNIYIGLYHDPIYNAKTFLGETFDERYKSITYFDKNDFVLLGDIHMLQYFRDNKSAAYCSSLIQQNHGESPNEHGYILWDIESKTKFNSVFRDIKNVYNYITFNVDKGYDYNNILLENQYANENSEIKIKWKDISAIVDDRDIKDRFIEYIKNKYNTDKITFSRTAIIKNIGEVNIDENIDILNIDVQKEIFTEYLLANNYEQKIIDKILEYDIIINERLNYNSVCNVNWGIVSCWFNNFKIYGDDNYLNLNDKKGIIQINGDNQAGKTTILDAITYVLYGTTISTNNKKKHGDKRYINKNRDKDTCDAGTVIYINDKFYTLVRKTERKWSSDNSKITSCSTILDIYDGLEINEKNKLTEEQKKDTQKFIEKSIGTFDDFIRIVLTTADNLNNLLSMDRSVFIDAVSKDAGFDIFDKKLNEYKDYYKEICNDFIKINKKELEDEIKKYETLIDEINKEILSKNEYLDNLNNQRDIKSIEKDNLSKSLHQIDPEIETIDIDNLNELIEKLENNIINNQKIANELLILEKSIKVFDNTVIDNIDNELNKNNKEILNIEKQKSDNLLKINNIENDIKNEITNKENKLISIKNKLMLEVKDLENKLSKMRTEFLNSITNYTISLKDEKSILNDKKNTYITSINNILSKKSNLENENSSLEQSKICPVCKRELEAKEILVINEKVLSNKKLLEQYSNEINKIQPLCDEITNKINNIDTELLNITDKKYPQSLNELLNKSKKEADIIKNNISEINNKILNNKIEIDYKVEDTNILNLNNTKELIENKISQLNSLLKRFSADNEELNEKRRINIIEKNNYEQLKEKISKKDFHLLNIEKDKNTIIYHKDMINKKLQSIKFIEENKLIKEKIDSIVTEIEKLNLEIYHLNNEKTLLISDKKMSKDIIEKNILLLEKNKQQEETEYHLSIYKKCVHRDGLPSFLLRKSIDIINNELMNLLEDVDFQIFFNNDLVLELVHDITPKETIECVTSSGMERTFSAIVLKLALRKINTKSKPSFLIFDEIMGKLNKKNVEKFNNLIEKIKKQIDNIIIIEHQNVIDYDYIIDVKQENGISTFEIN